jgi:hypothetical protein
MTRITAISSSALLALFALMQAPPSSAQVAVGIKPVAGRTSGGGINYAPRPGLYTIVLIDAKAKRLRVRDVEGKTIDTNVAEGAYDLSKLKNGDKIRIDFVAQETPQQKPTAAVIFPAK